MSDADIHTRLAGIILAGGQSSRMGEDKAALVWRDRTLLEHARDLMTAMGVGLVRVSGRPDLPDGIADSERHAGPARALCDAARALKGEAGAMLVIPVDMPMLEIADLVPLLDGDPLGARAYADHPLPARLPVDTLTDLPLDDVWSIRQLLKSAGTEWLPLPASRSDHFGNINTRDEFASLPGRD